MSIIAARTRTLALSFLISLLLTACFDGDNKHTAAPPVGATPAEPTPAPTPTANQAPRISGTPLTSAKTGQPYAFQPTAVDPDGDKVTFSVSNKPAWASFDIATGKLAGTPS
ncbi:MAG: putative Ig domain-containing protein, partial [Gammaproteobacteria bacterium]|nr:putative Ig domain-containing protein [Gammaproteobacteria bacterium]